MCPLGVESCTCSAVPPTLAGWPEELLEGLVLDVVAGLPMELDDD